MSRLPPYRLKSLLRRQIRSIHSSPLLHDSAIQQLVASAQNTARQLKDVFLSNQANDTSGSASATSSAMVPTAKVATSLAKQAVLDLNVDLNMARSLQAQKQRVTAPSLHITPGVREDIPADILQPKSRNSRRLQTAVETGQTRKSRRSRLAKKRKAETLKETAVDGNLTSTTDDKTGMIVAKAVRVSKIKPPRKMQIARLRRQLGRVLFSPGVQPLRDARTGVWNFHPSLHDIPRPEEFAFERCPPYIPPSQDSELSDLAKQYGCRFSGSTSTLTKALSQIYFALSGGKGVNLATLSQDFTSERSTFTPGAELPASLIVNKMEDDHYSVDSDKRLDVENVISDFGRILEKMLTAEVKDFERFLRSSPDEAVPEEERTAKEAYQYQRSGSLLMRSQLDCYDPRLPGSGVFDIKTRACLPVRYDRANYLANSAYDVWKERGYTQSFEREYYDLLRAGMLKFSLQVRIGAMDGIFLAYHNTSRIYGFQYIPLSEIDQRLFGSTELAEQAFKLSVAILEKLLQRCVDAFPGKSVAVTMKRLTAAEKHSFTAYVEPTEWEDTENTGKKPIQAITFSLQNLLDKQVVTGPIMLSIDEKVRKAQNWSVEYKITESTMDEEGQQKARAGQQRLRQELISMNSLYVPDGQSVQSMTQSQENKSAIASVEGGEEDAPAVIKWKKPGPRQLQLRKEAKESGQAYEIRKRSWKKGQIMSIA